MKPKFELPKIRQTTRQTRNLLCVLLLSLSASACSILGFGSNAPDTPSGGNRVPVNGNRAALMQPINTKAQAAPLPVAALDLDRASFVLEGKANGNGRSVRVSLFDTLQKIADNTGLRFVDNGLKDEKLTISPSSDPFNVLRQLAQKSGYRINLDREKARLWASDNTKKDGVVVFKEANAFLQVGSPVRLKRMPEEPVLLTEAMRLLAPDDFDVGFSERLDTNIFIDLSKIKSWEKGLETVALQSPYKIVFDWDKRLVYALPVLSKGL